MRSKVLSLRGTDGHTLVIHRARLVGLLQAYEKFSYPPNLESQGTNLKGWILVAADADYDVLVCY